MRVRVWRDANRKKRCRRLAVALAVALLAGQFGLSAYAEEEQVSSALMETTNAETDEKMPEESVDGSEDGNVFEEGNGGTGESNVPKEGESNDNESGLEGDNALEEDEDGSVDDGEEIFCICDNPCGEGNVNADCLLCAVDYEKCMKKPEEEESEQETVSENTLSADGGVMMLTEGEPEIHHDHENGYSVSFEILGDVMLKFRYLDLEKDLVSVAGHYENGGKWKIPATVEYDGRTYTVVQIGREAFSGCHELTEIELPDSITDIAEQAFSGCENLSKIGISPNLTHIGSRAFYDCKILAEISLPDTIEMVDVSAFANCENLKQIKLPDKKIDFGAAVFYGCRSLSNVDNILAALKDGIPNSMFMYCKGLTEANIPEGITAIGQQVFYECTGLTRVSIPPSVREIDHFAFWSCGALTEVSMAEGVKTLGCSVFQNCTSLRKVDLPDSITSIAENGFWDATFSGCTSLIRVKLPQGISKIGDGMFRECVSLKDVKIPLGVTSIESSAFWNCRALTSINLPAKVWLGYGVFSGCDSLTELRIAVTVTEENGSRYVDIPTLNAEYPESVFSSSSPWENRRLVFLKADGVNPLTGDDFAAAKEAYLSDEDENTDDNLWRSWKIGDAYTITATAATGGTIVPVGNVVVAEGADQTFTITSDEGYHIKSVTVDGNAVIWEEAVQVLADADAVQTGRSGTYTISNVRKNYTIEASFEVDDSVIPGEENPPKGDNDPDNSGNDRPSGGTIDSDPDGGNSGGGNGGTANANNAEAPAAEVMITVVDSNVQAAPAAATETAAPAAQNGGNRVTADNAAAPKGTQSREPKTDDSTQMEIYATLAMIAGLIYMLLYFMEEGRSMTEREKDVFVAAFIRWAKKGGVFRKCCAIVVIFCILVFYHSVGKREKRQMSPART